MVYKYTVQFFIYYVGCITVLCLFYLLQHVQLHTVIFFGPVMTLILLRGAHFCQGLCCGVIHIIFIKPKSICVVQILHNNNWFYISYLIHHEQCLHIFMVWLHSFTEVHTHMHGNSFWNELTLVYIKIKTDKTGEVCQTQTDSEVSLLDLLVILNPG